MPSRGFTRGRTRLRRPEVLPAPRSRLPAPSRVGVSSGAGRPGSGPKPGVTRHMLPGSLSREPFLGGHVTRIAVEARQSREQSVSDVALLERVAEGDVRALSELSARHSLSLRALQRSRVRAGLPAISA